MIFCLGLIVGGIYQGIGNDATKALFNFGFCFTVTIAFMYIPLMPVLLQFPMEVQLLKREHFNRWFRIGPYYLAMTAAKLPMQIVLAFGYITMIYTMSDQPLEFNRMAMFYSISVLIALTSESLGVLISARLSLIVSCPLFSYKKSVFFKWLWWNNNVYHIFIEWNVCWTNLYSAIDAVGCLWYRIWTWNRNFTIHQDIDVI